MLVPLWSIIRNRLKETAEHRGIPTFIVADAGRTQVSFMLADLPTLIRKTSPPVSLHKNQENNILLNFGWFNISK